MLESLVIDEADLILSYGHDTDVRQIFGGAYLPKVYQSFLMSATVTEDVETLKGLTLRSPVRYIIPHKVIPFTLSLGHSQIRRRSKRNVPIDPIFSPVSGPHGILTCLEFCASCSEVDKFLLTYVILKLRLIKGKCILFVNDVDRCYRLKLFLEQFSIKSCVLNSELPLNSRWVLISLYRQCAIVKHTDTTQCRNSTREYTTISLQLTRAEENGN